MFFFDVPVPCMLAMYTEIFLLIVVYNITNAPLWVTGTRLHDSNSNLYNHALRLTRTLLWARGSESICRVARFQDGGSN